MIGFRQVTPPGLDLAVDETLEGGGGGIAGIKNLAGVEPVDGGYILAQRLVCRPRVR